jgi:SAM-dependent methyltransferase
VLVTSRSFEEYAAFFALSRGDLRARLLDCSAGASGFAAAAGATGADVTAVDPIYAEPRERLRAAAEAAQRDGAAIIDAHDDRFTWRWYGSPERRSALRAAGLAAFADDLERHPERYVPGALPDLPFEDGAFDLALCSHLLFTWSDRFDEAWHEAALRELLRVASEVRVFPLVRQGTGDPVPFLEPLLARIREGGVDAVVERVPYEFQVGADRMLRLRRPEPASRTP